MKPLNLPLIVALGAAFTFAMRSGSQQSSSLQSLNSELLKAAEQGDTGLISTLLDEGANLKDEALLRAAQQEKSDAVKLLLDRGANIEARDINGNTPVILAPGCPQIDALKLLLDRGANLEASNHNHETALTEAARRGCLASISLLLARGTFTDDEKKKALFAAAESEPPVITVGMPPADMPPSTNNDTYHGPIADWPGAVKILLQDGGMSVDVRYGGETLLMHAAEFGQTDAVKMLLEMGASVDAADASGNTPLLVAACNCVVIDMPDTLESMELLLDAGANVQATNQNGDTPLMRAAAWGQADNAKLLLGRGAKIDERNNDGDTALTLAAKADYGSPADTLKLLVERGASVNAMNHDGNTSLILLASAPYYRSDSDTSGSVRLLLARGADPRVTNHRGETALSAARRARQAGVVSLLQEALAK